MYTEQARLLACALGVVCLGCSSTEDATGDTSVVGLLLPFTGTASATASNFERAAIFAADRINAGGGVAGRKIRVLARDTHSEIARGESAARELIDAGAVAVIGPESPEIAAVVAPLFAERGVLFLSPLIGAAGEPSGSCDAAWFRLAPSARSLGEALAKQAISTMGAGEGTTGADAPSVAVMSAAGEYDRALGDAAARRFVSLGGNVVLRLELNPGAQSYATEVMQAIDAGAQAVVLAASPRAAALVINEYDALRDRGSALRWFLSPLLKTELLVQNVAPEALEGAQGVAPKIYDNGVEFPEAFSERWLGDQPLEGAYFYYDAMALIAAAVQKVHVEIGSDDHVSLDELERAMLDVAASPGEVMRWDELEVGLARLHDGEDVYYTGLTGPLLLEKCGARRIGVASEWAVTGGTIVEQP